MNQPPSPEHPRSPSPAPTPLPDPPSPARVREVLDLAMERPSHERPAFIAGVCGDDPRLREELVSLLAALDAAGDALEPPSAEPSGAVETAPLTGLSFGNFRVAERVGEGGMGVVYRAEDTRLGRTVAVKALPPSLARDPHRRARFEHEARILASLNHPNIAAIYGVEETARGPVLVLEFVAGQTLAHRLDSGPLPPDEAIATAIQIAHGLEAAHLAGVVHRDLKPSNIQLMPDGGVKLLDFGVSKQTLPGARPNSGPAQTQPGNLIGTAAYMSPEQARGRPVDRRTDLWAFGCVLFEMLTGRRAFDGETSSDSIAAVLRTDPDWLSLPPETPPGALRVLRRCLEKDPEGRQRDAGDAALELADAGGAGRASEHSTAAASVARRGVRTPLALAAIPVGLGLVAVALAMKMRTAPERSAADSLPTPVQFSLEIKPEHAVSMTPGGALAVSPDGSVLVFAGGPGDRTRLYARHLDSSEIMELVGTDGAAEPCFSPDGRWIAFRSGVQIRRVPAAGGASEVVVPHDVGGCGIAWGEPGIVYWDASPPGLRLLSPEGETTQFTTLDVEQEYCHIHPEVLPGGNVVLFTNLILGAGNQSTPRIEAVDRASGERRLIASDACAPRFIPPNRLVFWQAGSLVSAPFDVHALRLTDPPSVVQRPMAGGELMPAPRFAVSRAGVLATLPGGIRYDPSELAWYQADGSWTHVTEAWPSIDAPRISPDGSRIVMLSGLSGGDVWVIDTPRSTRLRLTTCDNHHHPVWTRDGRRVTFTTTPVDQPARIEQIVADGSSPAETLWVAPAGVWAYPTDFTLDGRLLLTSDLDSGQTTDLFLFDLSSREVPKRLMPQPGHRYGARLSPDGGLIAYTSEETGTVEVYLHRFPSLEPKVRVSATGGYRPVWSGDGKKLFFRYVDRVLVVDVSTANGELTVSPARMLAEHLPDARYDADTDGGRLLMARPPGELGLQTRIDITVGWKPEAPR